MSLTAKVLLTPVLVAQALYARATVPQLQEAAGHRAGVEGSEPDAPPSSRPAPITLLVAGDSSAAGVGVTHQRDALAQPLAAHLAAAVRRPVRWRLVAQSGLTTAGTHDHLRRHAEAARAGVAGGPVDADDADDGAGQPLQADFAVIVTGVNDVVDQVPSHRAVAAREALANWLRNACGVRHVAFAPLPPVHHFPGLPQPLRWVAGADARRHDRALAEWAATRGDVTHVPLALKLEGGMMASDGFHPGPGAYRAIAHVLALHLAGLLARYEGGDDSDHPRRPAGGTRR